MQIAGQYICSGYAAEDLKSPTLCTLGHAGLYVGYAFAELLLRVAEILVGTREMLHLFIKLLLHLRELLRREAGKVDCRASALPSILGTRCSTYSADLCLPPPS